MKRILSLCLCFMLIGSFVFPAKADVNMKFKQQEVYMGKSYLNGMYSGPMQNGKPAGKGVLRWDHCRYEGNFVDGYPSGNGTFYFKNGICLTATGWGWYHNVYDTWVPDRQGADMYYTGMSLYGESFGYGYLNFCSGGTYLGEFVDDDPHGWGIYTYRSPSSEYNRTKESDNWTMVYNNYRLEHNYTGLKIGSNWQGFGIGIKNSGYAYCGEVVNDYRDGHGELYRKNDTLEQWGIYRRGGIKTVYQLP